MTFCLLKFEYLRRLTERARFSLNAFMSSRAAELLHSRDRRDATDKVVALFVCPGAKEVAIPHAVFPYGSGCSQMEPCPRREFCLWYASHDLGGELEFSDVPDGAQLTAEFTTGPFSCPRWKWIDDPRNRRANATPRAAE